jgi:hypothetical protein
VVTRVTVHFEREVVVVLRNTSWIEREWIVVGIGNAAYAAAAAAYAADCKMIRRTTTRTTRPWIPSMKTLSMRYQFGFGFGCRCYCYCRYPSCCYYCPILHLLLLVVVALVVVQVVVVHPKPWREHDDEVEPVHSYFVVVCPVESVRVRHHRVVVVVVVELVAVLEAALVLAVVAAAGVVVVVLVADERTLVDRVTL